MSEYSQHSHDDSFELEDEDTCTPTELEQYFKHKYKIHDEVSVTDDDNYILRLAKDDAFTYLAAGLSDGSVRVFEINSEKGLYVKTPQSNTMKDRLNICGVRFLDETPNHLLVGTTNGLVRLLDLRTQSEVSRFEIITTDSNEPKTINCFDRNSNSTLLCMGTNEFQTNVHILFYDIRTSNWLFNYTESHQNDVTSLRFHPSSPYTLCSGSTDGLINIFDVNNSLEDDALLTTINTEESVYRLNWHTSSKNKDRISCITDTNDFKTYKINGDLIAEFDRLQITEIIKRKNEANCTLINCHDTSSKDMMLVTGSYVNNGEIVRSCISKKGKLKPYASFEKNSYIIRDSILDEKTDVLITGGETGIVTLWTPNVWQADTINSSANSSDFKIKTKTSNRVVPY